MTAQDATGLRIPRPLPILDREPRNRKTLRIREMWAEGRAVQDISLEMGLFSASSRMRKQITAWIHGEYECTGCAAELLEPSPVGLCGFCIVDRKLAA